MSGEVRKGKWSIWSKLALVVVLLGIACVYFGDWKNWSEREHTQFLPTYNNEAKELFQSNTEPNIKLHVMRWEVPKPKGLIFIVHGYGEHIARYDTTAKAFNAAQYSVLGIDHQGHGLSGGDRAYVKKFSNYAEDFKAFAKEELKKYEGKNIPSFLLGHSMGGLISFLSVITDPFVWKGFIVSGPFLTPPDAVLLNIVEYGNRKFPKLPVPITVDAIGLNSNETEREIYLNDPLVYHGWVKVGWGREILTTVTYVWENIDKIKLPLLFLHGIEDTICPIQFSLPFFEQIPAKQKKFIKYPVMRHEIFHEPEKKVVFSDIISWLDARV